MSIPFDQGSTLEESPLTVAQVGRYWDDQVEGRGRELQGRDDLAYRWLTNWILRTVGRLYDPPASVVDVGCGLGFVTREIAALGYETVGVDPSVRSVEFASSENPGPCYVAGSVDCLQPTAIGGVERGFDVAVANMVLHNAPNLNDLLLDIADVLKPGGSLVATIAHPFTYLGGRAEVVDDYEYGSEGVYMLPFRIHEREPHPGLVPYFHRRFATYFEGLLQAGFQLEEVDEPLQVGLGRRSDVLTFVAQRVGTD